MNLLEGTKLEVLHKDVTSLPNDEYALLRREGLGASDSSVIMGVLPYKDVDTLIKEKRSRIITDEERMIGDKDSVRKGRDLEPLILQKFAVVHESTEPEKPTAMYVISGFEYLTINFDGVLEEDGNLVPVECKFVTTYGDKYYNRSIAYQRERGECEGQLTTKPYAANNMQARIKAHADQCGIPAYYYTQVQQQMLGLNAPYGYLCALHDKGWELVIYRVPRDEEVIRGIQIAGFQTWQKIKK